MVIAGGGCLGMALLPMRAISASEPRIPTPAQTPGPYYPRSLPAERDNDLAQVARNSPALGSIAQVHGAVLDTQGRPLPAVLVEIWQCDANGRYRHPADTGERLPDPGFQGYGQFITGDDGVYRFRTIRPVAYPGRTPHIHFRLSRGGKERLVTQLYVAGDPGNAHDPLFNASTARAREQLTTTFAPRAGSNELEARFDIVLA
jgi:protocatechuate 3,4-dioxygenase beta subunit